MPSTRGRSRSCVPSRWCGMVSEALTAAGVEHGQATRHGLDQQVTVVPVGLVKGLELDAVVVVEPAAIVDEEAQGCARCTSRSPVPPSGWRSCTNATCRRHCSNSGRRRLGTMTHPSTRPRPPTTCSKVVDLHGKRFVVTGASTGLGEETTRARRGARRVGEHGGTRRRQGTRGRGSGTRRGARRRRRGASARSGASGERARLRRGVPGRARPHRRVDQQRRRHGVPTGPRRAMGSRCSSGRTISGTSC